jgi:hypothetical protein
VKSNKRLKIKFLMKLEIGRFIDGTGAILSAMGPPTLRFLA